MHQLIVDILETLGIDLAYQEYDGSSEEYIVFYIDNENDDNFSDDINETEEYEIVVRYYYKSLKNIEKYKKIKSLMKQNNFSFYKCNDSKKDDYYCKDMNFRYTKEDLYE